MRELGAQTHVCVPAGSLPTAERVYGNEDTLFVPYDDAAGAGSALGAIAAAEVAVATEYPSVDLLARLARARPHTLCAYYVQDYEPLFAAPQSSRADRALLSYRALPGVLLFAKTRWLCDLVEALHGVPVAKVAPSLDRTLFHSGGRRESSGPLHVAAMIRPRTPRRRPAATLQALLAVTQALGPRVSISTFGCEQETFSHLFDETPSGGRHLGLLSRLEVSELMRRCDVFLDASAYQAFGRTGLEAMACGAVPVLPDLGGVHEYAVHDENAVLLDDGDPREVAEAVAALAEDPQRLRRLRDAGLRKSRRFSIARAARSQLELFTAALARTEAPAGSLARTEAPAGSLARTEAPAGSLARREAPAG
jgi:Glycosyl transferases group 1